MTACLSATLIKLSALKFNTEKIGKPNNIKRSAVLQKDLYISFYFTLVNSFLLRMIRFFSFEEYGKSNGMQVLLFQL